MDFGFGLPPDSKRRTGVVVFVDRFSKMVHLAAVPAEVTAVGGGPVVLGADVVVHGLPPSRVVGSKRGRVIIGTVAVYPYW
ncbi:hypothetical protein PC116_g30084 [Phytophthora cactorum]|uniref:Uncharacterized protein n=1 Tax=Phytophthora cactorum TaxID=29920 RepID=A0A8T1JGY6_9STRA|nr:hypothetical protein PC114_g27489 [Phytophthora cactorum]KAG2875641.1 hypothetical protein PC117_g27394 [Phytophthora cactorum]KAG2957755.1 hypothetical protein PC119_g27229 [Phytophthora cactorum]KAG2968593.1 hypothetical protein PC120_g26798 [Phytophthora cactorum]KAG3121973.1 hypothetical protein C6341_g27160 [Phytophthora cactorum]